MIPSLIPSLLWPPLIACGVIVFLCWVISIVAKNYSQVDRLWSILPVLYIGYFAASQRFTDPRLDLMFALVFVWGARLTYNFARKGGYRWDSEDYRWPVLRQRMSPVAFQLFNLGFIATFQNVLLLAISLPAYVAATTRTPLGVLDVVFGLGFVLFLLGETIADRQQWDFHASKHARLAAGETVDPPFLTTGLFRFSRHPNFFCEMAMWWCVYGFAVAATGIWLQPTIAGVAVLTLLFQGSTTMTEGLTRAKYPSYAAYQRSTSRLIPLPPRKPS